jgi:hypothetical protein
MDTDANRNLYPHTYCYSYGHADTDSDANLNGDTYCDTDAYRYYNCHACPEHSRRASANGDSCPAHGHTDIGLSIPARWTGPTRHVTPLSRVPQGTGLYRRHGT